MASTSAIVISSDEDSELVLPNAGSTIVISDSEDSDFEVSPSGDRDAIFYSTYTF